MKTYLFRGGLVLLFAIGAALFFYGLSGLSSSFGPGSPGERVGEVGGFEWAVADRYFIALGALLMGVPLGFRIIR